MIGVRAIFRRERRNFSGDILVCLPLLAVIFVILALFFTVLPRLEESERMRLRESYREIAIKIHSREIGSTDYPYDGRKYVGRLSQGSWGFEINDGKALVWYREPKSPKVHGIAMTPVATTDYRMWFYVIGVLFAVLMVGLTDLGLRRFRAFAREREDFIRAAAHDLRTPVATLKMLAEDSGDARIVTVTERMRRMVVNLSDFVNLGGKRPSPRRECIDLVKLAHEAYESFRRDFETDYQPVAFSGESALASIGDSDLVVQIFWNLFGNELKYAAPFGQITVKFKSERNESVIRFIDSGPGMTARERRRVFDSCYRAASALKSGKGGFGLGLCTSREFARAMGGSLNVGPHGHGSVFDLRLPANPSRSDLV